MRTSFMVFPAAFVAFAALLTAQSELATLSGVITDPTGALVTGVEITAINEATNRRIKTQSNEDGRYIFTSLRPGGYTVSAVHAGFKKAVRTAVTLNVNQAARLDLTLPIGDVSESISVAAESPLLETDSASRGAVIDQRKIVELPLNGRDYNQLALLSPDTNEIHLFQDGEFRP